MPVTGTGSNWSDLGSPLLLNTPAFFPFPFLKCSSWPLSICCGNFPGSPVVKTLHFLCFTAGDTGSIPGQRTKIPHAMWCGQKKKKNLWISLVVQWTRICLPMQGTWVWSLVWEDSTCLRATKPMCHNYWASMLQLLKAGYSTTCVPQEKPLQWEVHALQWRVASTRCN